MEVLDVVVIGGGPVGLAAGVRAQQLGMRVAVLEAGRSVGTHVSAWGHVRLFSPWSEVIDPVGGALLTESGWSRPVDGGYPTGSEVVGCYLEPLAGLPGISAILRFGHRVVSVGRVGADKASARRRDPGVFSIVARDDLVERRFEAQAVIDATGTWATPNPVGTGGLPAVGEQRSVAEGRLAYGVPDVLGSQRALYAGQRVGVVGSGHSAQNLIVALGRLAEDEPSTCVTWVMRSREVGSSFITGEDDGDSARRNLALAAGRVVEAGLVDVELGFSVSEVESGAGILLHSLDAATAGPLDRVIVATGFRPDLAMTRELRLDLDPDLECPRNLAAVIDPDAHTCDTVPVHGAAALSHPEPGFFTIGMKSYGRAPTFLLATGYAQADSVIATIADAREPRFERDGGVQAAVGDS